MEATGHSGILRIESEVIELMRKEVNMHNKEDREKAITIIEEWIKKQDHFLKKDFSRDFIESSILSSKGSVELAKQRIDTSCAMKTLMPGMFRYTDFEHKDLEVFLSKINFAIMPNLTEEYYRVVVIKAKAGIEMTVSEVRLTFPCIAVIAQYLKCFDKNRGFYLIGDFMDVSPVELLSKLNLLELQQFSNMLTGGFAFKIKGIFAVTGSKWIETFLKIIKSMFSVKIASRVHSVSSRKKLQDFIPGDVVSEEYGGRAKSVELLHEDLVASLAEPKVQEVLKDMSKAGTDESKRKTKDKFFDQFMGIPGSFRTLSLD